MKDQTQRDPLTSWLVDFLSLTLLSPGPEPVLSDPEEYLVRQFLQGG